MAALSRCNEFFDQGLIESRSEIETKYRKHFRCTNKWISLKGRARGNFLPQFHCLECNKNFGTTHEAMARHADAHIADDYIVIGKFDVSEGQPNHGLFNPGTHRFDKNYDHFTISTQAKLAEIVVPTNSIADDGKIKCRFCPKFEIKFDGLGLSRQQKLTKKMQLHEANCRRIASKKKAGKESGASAKGATAGEGENPVKEEQQREGEEDDSTRGEIDLNGNRITKVEK